MPLAEASGRGWQAELYLRFARGDARTELRERRHRGPLAIQRPFYPERDGTCHAYILHPPGGVVGGDELEIALDVESGARVLVTTPAAGKFYRSGGATALQMQTLRVAPGATLEWLPQESIVYDGARVATTTRVILAEGAAFTGWEILCLGRPAAGERFNHGAARLAFELWRGDAPLVLERAHFAGGDRVLDAPWGLHGHSVTATLMSTGADPATLATVRDAWQQAGDTAVAATLVDGVLLARYLGDSASDAHSALARAWSVVRDRRGRAAITPRIWST